MGILNIDEHVEEHRLMAIRYPDKAVIPGQSVIAQSNIPFLIMPGDGGANGCSFSGTAGAFTLSAAILANIYVALTGCYAYFSANFGGSTLPDGWYWTEFSSDTAGIVYANTYQNGIPSRITTKTPIPVDLSGRITATTSEVSAISGLLLPAGALGKNGVLSVLLRQIASINGNKTYRVRAEDASTTQLVLTGTAASPAIDTLHAVVCRGSHTIKNIGRVNSTASSGIGTGGTNTSAASVVDTCDTSTDTRLSITLQQSTNTAGIVLLASQITATYGE
jgi:hypothetical protein